VTFDATLTKSKLPVLIICRIAVRSSTSVIYNERRQRPCTRACVCIRVCSSRLYASVVNFSCEFYISHKYITATVRLPRIHITEHRRRLGSFVTSFVLIVSHVGLPAAETGYQGVTIGNCPGV